MTSKKRALVICARRYNGHELWTALGVLKNNNVGFEVVSTDTIILDEKDGKPNRLKRLVYDVKLDELDSFDGLMVVSGNPDDTEGMWDDERILNIVAAFNENDRPIAAICASVPTVRYAAKGKKVSFYPLIRSRERLNRAGAICTTVALTCDANLITGEYQMVTEEWAEGFVLLLNGNRPEINRVDSKWSPAKERKPVPEIEKIKVLRAKAIIDKAAKEG